ncbi:MAG TPA: hypothetical protein VKR21_18605 [Solirubrobacteraceae bacterium]|nr:hypothetical protein [Solirubrobacteraceae bacterium]
MRGGAIPIFAWGVLLSILTIGNAIWEGRWIQAGEFALAAVLIFSFGAFIVGLGGRSAIRRGPPSPSPHPEPLPWSSLATVAAALSLAMLLFGFVFGSALIYLGAGFLAFSLGRLGVELRAQRASLKRLRGERVR